MKAPRGLGFVTNPKKAAYNYVYRRTTFGIEDMGRTSKINYQQVKRRISKPGIESTGEGSLIRSSSKALKVTSNNLDELRQDIVSIQSRRSAIVKSLSAARRTKFLISLANVLSKLLIFGFFIKRLNPELLAAKNEIAKLEDALSQAYVNLEFADKSQFEKSWLDCLDTFDSLKKSEKIWDVTYEERVNKIKARTIANTGNFRTEVSFSDVAIPFIHSDVSPISFSNANGAQLIFFPTFLMMYKDDTNFGLISLEDLNFEIKTSSFVEEKAQPKDSEVIELTWKKANKDGSPDRRFRDNYQIPVMRYGKIRISGKDGLDEEYMFSNFGAVDDFRKSLTHHLKQLSKKSSGLGQKLISR